MFDFTRHENDSSKCYVTHGVMGHIDPKQPPTKRKPFAAILALPFVHKIELLLPREVYELIKDDLSSRFSHAEYSRVILPLSALLEGDFFNEYIKKGNIIMLSEGRKDVKNLYHLRDGILTLKLDKESYERAGLAGKPDSAKGARGIRDRWIVEQNLRLPSMLHGKKGFERLIYACKNALQEPVTWLFIDLEGRGMYIAIIPGPSPDHRLELSRKPLAKHFPVPCICYPSIVEDLRLRVPSMQLKSPSETSEFREFTSDLYEWLALVSLESPRTALHDDIDPFLSRYKIPDVEESQPAPQNAVRVIWEGFMSTRMAHEIFILAAQKMPPKAWLSFSTYGFSDSFPESKDCTVLRLPTVASEYLLWEVEQI